MANVECKCWAMVADCIEVIAIARRVILKEQSGTFATGEKLRQSMRRNHI